MVLILFFAIIFSHAEASEIEALGLFIKFSPNTDQKLFQKEALKHHLKSQTYYEKLNIHHYTAKTTKLDELLIICEKLKSSVALERCEPNRKPTLDNEYCSFTEGGMLNAFLEKTSPVIAKINCPLLQTVTIEAKTDTKKVSGLSDYWAQEYTGADLLRNYLEKNPTMWTLSLNDFDILDVDNKDHHSEKVSHLIAGPNPTALMPITKEKNHIQILSENDYLRYANKKKSAPVINNSMTWYGDSVKDAIKSIAHEGAIFVIASGNDGNKVINWDKSELAKNKEAIIVGSASYLGINSHFSQHDPNIPVLAPSNTEVLSYDKNGPGYFGGTSGAAPQVTAALLAFNAITGYRLTTQEAHELLKSTATPSIHLYEDSPKHGSGMLNTYMIGQIGILLKERCKKDLKCIKDNLSKTQSIFPPKDLKDAQSSFGHCFSNSKIISTLDCEVKKQHFSQLRAEALLHPNDTKLLNGIACIYDDLGFDKNADYYRYAAAMQNKITMINWVEKMIREKPFDLSLGLLILYNKNFPERDKLLNLLDKKESLPLKYALAKYFYNKKKDASVVESTIEGKGMRLLDLFSLQMQGATSPEKFELLKGALMSPEMTLVLKKNILSDPKWRDYPEALIAAIATDLKNDEFINKNLLQLPHWQQAFVEVRPLTVQNLRKSKYCQK